MSISVDVVHSSDLQLVTWHNCVVCVDICSYINLFASISSNNCNISIFSHDLEGKH